MPVVNGTNGNDFIHRDGDGRSVPAAYTDLLGVTTGNDTIYGLAGNDFIFGDLGNDIINGGTGADTMDGGAGNDWFYVDAATDAIIEGSGSGSDRILSSVNYVLGAGVAVELITTTNTAGAGALNLTGNEFVQSIAGNAGANILDGRGGADTLIGYGGNDFYYVDSVGDSVVEVAGQGSDRVLASVSYILAATSHVEFLSTTTTLGTATINLTGNALAQSILGNAGANLINGAGGADTMSGLEGNDIYYVDNVADVVTEAAGAGSDRVLASVNYTLGATTAVELFTTTNTAGTGALNLTGNQFAQTIAGNAGANLLNGRGGADTMIGYGGNDWYYVDSAGDQVTEGAGSGSDRVLASVNYALAAAAQIEIFTTTNTAGTGAINLTGNDFSQQILGNAGTNTLDGRGGNDILNGGGGDDTLDGGSGADTLTGSTGDDIYIFDNAGDTAIESDHQGLDLVRSSVSATLAPWIEDLVLMGSAAINGTGNEISNILTGNSAANILDGGGLNDTLDGGAGADTMIGGAGEDIYYVDNLSDVVIETAEWGSDRVIVSFDYTLPDNVEQGSVGSAEGRTLTGNALGNRLTGNAGNDILYGEAGNDGLNGGLGLDSLYGGAGDDSLESSGGGDVLTGGTGDDTYYIRGAGDTVVENLGEGTDYLETSLSIYWLPANVENAAPVSVTYPTMYGNELDNIISLRWSGGGDLYGQGGNDTLTADSDEYGISYNYHLYGGTGNDILRGAEWADRLQGDSGADNLWGGTGPDGFYFVSWDDSTIAAFDTIQDFGIGDEPYDEDVIDLSAIDAIYNPDVRANEAFTYVAFSTGAAGQIWWEQSAPNMFHVYADIDGGGADIRIDVVTSSLGSNDFVF